MNLILNEISKQNRKVFKTFFNQHYKNLVVYANGYLFDKHASEDVVQEVYIYIWENADRMNIKSSLKNYLYVMVRNKCFNYLKSIKITDSYDYLDLNISSITEQVFDSASEDDKQIVFHQILKIVDSLPDKMQQIVRLKYLHHYKYAEIAAELGVSINTVKTQLKRAKVKISDAVTIIVLLLQMQ
jgi:RNA polymerase sigma-70 factor (family 1)